MKDVFKKERINILAKQNLVLPLNFDSKDIL